MRNYEAPLICVYKESPKRISIKHTVFPRMYMHESGQRIEGFKFKNYRPDHLIPSRIIKTFDTITEAKEFRKTIAPESIPNLKSEITLDVPPKRQNHSNIGFEVCFTGFDKDKRAALEGEAECTGMIVRTKMTKKLTALCVGPNAGPAKFEQALKDDILIMTEDEFGLLLSTGVLPPPPSQDVY